MENLSTDVIGDICAYLEAKHLYQLWVSGSARLYTLLRTAVRSLSFDITDGKLVRPYWPGFAAYLPSLESLEIIANFPSQDLLLRSRLSALTSTSLRSLRLSYTGAYEDYVEAILAAPHIFDHLESLEIPILGELPTLPPNVTRLSLKDSPELSRRRMPPYVIDLHSYIPRSVTSLYLHFEVTGFIGDFNPNLQELGFRVPSFRTFQCPPLPPALTALHLREGWDKASKTETWECPDWSHLRSLTSLNLHRVHRLNDAFVSSLPPTLQTFAMGTVATLNITDLPLSLTRVDMRNSRVTMGALPRICELHLNSYEGVPLSAANFPCLTSMVIANLNLSPEQAALLPNTLTSLRIRCLLEDDQQLLPHLPSSLINLHLLKGLFNDIESWKRLPASLTYFDCAVSLSTCADHFVHLLPPRLRHFGIPSHRMNESIIKQNYWDMPSTIEYMNLPYREDMPIHDNFCSWASTHSHLATLHLNGNNISLPSVFLSYLPRTLRTLTLGMLLEVHDEHLAALPPSLTLLSIACPSPLSGNENLDAPSPVTINDRSISLLPRPLRVLFLPKGDFTEACASSLPPLLHSFQIALSRPSWFTPKTREELNCLDRLW